MIENKILTRFRDGQTNCIFPHFPDSAGLLGVVVKMRKSEVVGIKSTAGIKFSARPNQSIFRPWPIAEPHTPPGWIR